MNKTFTYREQKLSYQIFGAGKPLLLLHGWGSSGEVMMPLAKNIAHLRTCYVIDLPGFGASPEPIRGWEIDDYAAIIQAFTQSLNLKDTKADLLVHSFGGRIALKLCASEFGKKYFEKILITGGAGMKPKRSAGYFIRKYTAKSLKAPFLLLPSTQQQKALSWLRRTSIWRKLGSGDYSKLSGVMRETFVKSVNEYLEPCLPRIPHEVLLLWGSNDEATPLYQAERMEQGIPAAVLVVIEGAGHYAFLDKPKRFASIAEAFFKEG